MRGLKSKLTANSGGTWKVIGRLLDVTMPAMDTGKRQKLCRRYYCNGINPNERGVSGVVLHWRSRKAGWISWSSTGRVIVTIFNVMLLIVVLMSNSQPSTAYSISVGGFGFVRLKYCRILLRGKCSSGFQVLSDGEYPFQRTWYTFWPSLAYLFFLSFFNSMHDDTIDDEFSVLALIFICLVGLVLFSSFIMFVRIVGLLIIVPLSSFTIISHFCFLSDKIRLISPLSRFNTNALRILLGYDRCCLS